MSDEEKSQPYVVAVAVAVFRQERVLALRRAAGREAGPGLWETVSGRVRHGEQPAEAALREAAEECGLAVELSARPITAYAAARAGEPMIVIVYRADATTTEAVERSAEHDAEAWLTPDEFARASDLEPLVQAVYAAAQAGGRA